MDDREAAELLKAMVDHRMGEEFSKQNLLDKLYEAKIQEMRKNEILARDKIKALNDKKKDILEEELKIAERKGVHETLRQRGLDFLVELNMGSGPELEDIKKNIEVDPQSYSIYWLF